MGIFNTKGFWVAFFYGMVSISITFFNKAVFSLYDFRYSNALTLGQVLACLAFLFCMRRQGWIAGEPLRWHLAVQMVPLALSFAGMVITGLAALRFVNVPMFGALRRLATLAVVIGEYVMLQQHTPQDELLSILVMVASAVVAGIGDATGSILGYLMIVVNCIVTALYLIYIAKTKKETKLDTFTQMLYNNLLSLPFIVLLVVVFELTDGLLEFEYWFDPGFLGCFLMSSVLAFLLNWSIFLCSTINSPLTTSVTGQIKTIGTTIIGFFTFGDVVSSNLMIAGLFISSVASIWYAQIKYGQQMSQKSELPTTNPNSSSINNSDSSCSCSSGGGGGGSGSNSISNSNSDDNGSTEGTAPNL